MAIFLAIAMTLAQEPKFGELCINPYISKDSGISAKHERLLMTKMSQMVTAGGMTGSYDRRFIITPVMNIGQETTTASIPQKVSLKVDFTFFVGDGESASLFSSANIETTGVGDTHDDAVNSAIRKINANDANIRNMLETAKSKIVDYYNSAAPNIIKEAESLIKVKNYEQAILKLAVIPSLCTSFEKSQDLMAQCGAAILERDNNDLLLQAKSVWSTHPNEEGANAAYNYLSQVKAPSKKIKAEADKLNSSIRRTLVKREQDQLKVYTLQLQNEAEVRKEEINASANVAAAAIGSLPKLLFGILKWF